jgi:uncharacterized protein (TIGR03435 family)
MLLVFIGAAAAQSGSVALSFEAASVKRLPAGITGIRSLRAAPGRLAGAATLKALLMRAYDLKDYQIAGPAWIDSERYEVTAVFPAASDRQAVARMLQALLADRFGLTVHREKRQGAILSLVVAKGGPTLRESAAPAPAAEPAEVAPRFVRGGDGFPEIPPGSDLARTYEVVMEGSDGFVCKLWGRRETMRGLAAYLSGRLNREVLDRTGLRGHYDFTLLWAMDRGGGILRTGPPPDQIESLATPILPDTFQAIFGALQSQLGLRLETRRGVIEMLVVERARMDPIGN